MTSLTPLLWRHYPRYYDVTNPATMTSLPPLLWRHYPRYYDVTNPATMTALLSLLRCHFTYSQLIFTEGYYEFELLYFYPFSFYRVGLSILVVSPGTGVLRSTVELVCYQYPGLRGYQYPGYEGINIRGTRGSISGVPGDQYPGLRGDQYPGYEGINI